MPTELKIVFDDAGNVSVSGPLHDKVMCYGLLEAAKDAVREHCDQAAKRLVQPATSFPSASKRD